MSFEHEVILRSLPLKELDDSLRPINTASACQIKYKGQYIILTVQHATGNLGNWAIETEIDLDRMNTQYWQLGAMTHLARARVDLDTLKNSNVVEDEDLTQIFDDMKDIDLSFKVLPHQLHPKHQEVIQENNTKYLVSFDKITIETQLDNNPNNSDEYGFFGLVKPKINGNYINYETKIVTGLKFLTSFQDYYIFKFPDDKANMVDYKGCSGAPIIDSNGNLVSLVCKGISNAGKNFIWGINLEKYKIGIDIEIS